MIHAHRSALFPLAVAGLLGAALAAPADAADAGGRTPAPSGSPVKVQVEPTRQVMVVTSDADGASHELRVRAEDGTVVVTTEADPDRAWLGIIFKPEKGGLRVDAVVKGSPAEDAGLRAGDLITRFEGEVVGTNATSGSLLSRHEPGDEVVLAVERDGRKLEVTPRLEGHPGTMELDIAEGMDPFHIAGDVVGYGGLEALHTLKGLPGLLCLPKSSEDCYAFAFQNGFGGPRLGVMVEPLGEQLAEFFEVQPGRGILVTEVVKDGPAERAGLEAGDVIVRVKGKDIAQAADIRAALGEAKAGDAAAVEVIRRGNKRSFTVNVDEAPGAGQFRMAMPRLEGAHGQLLRELELKGLQGADAAISAESIRAAVERARAEIDQLRTERAEAEEAAPAMPRQERRVILEKQAGSGKEL